MCNSEKLLSNTTKKTMQSFVNQIYSHTQLLNNYQRGFIDGNNPISTTANILSQLKDPNLFAPKFVVENLPQFLEFLGEYNENSLRDLVYIAKFLKSFEKSVTIELENEELEYIEGKGLNIKAKLVKIGENQEFDSKQNPKISYQLANFDQKQISIKAIMKQISKSKNELSFEGHLSRLEELGLLKIELILINNDKTIFSVFKKVRVTKKAEPLELRFDVVQGNGKPEILSQNLKYEERMSREISNANQNSFLFAELSMSEGIEYAQVGIRLKHPTLSRVTNLVLAEFNSKSKVYSLVFDLGDPDLILPINGIYYGEIIVADPSLSEPFIWFISTNSGILPDSMLHSEKNLKEALFPKTQIINQKTRFCIRLHHPKDKLTS